MKDLGHRPNTLLLFNLMFEVLECGIQRWEMCVFIRCQISLHHLHSLHLTFPSLSHAPLLSNIHMTFTVSSLKVSQTMMLVKLHWKCFWRSYQRSRLSHGLVYESTYSSSVYPKHCFAEVRRVQTWGYQQELSCCNYAYSDTEFLVTCIKIPQSPSAGAVL